MNAAVHPEELNRFLQSRAEPLFFLWDSRSTLEQTVLQRWLDSSLRGTSAGDTNHCVLNTSAPDTAAMQMLEQTLQSLPDDTLIVPMRVLWLPREGRRRLRDLLLGNPHSPGSLIQQLILRFSPERCTPVFGKPASLAQLRDGLVNSDLDASIAQHVRRKAVLALKQVERKYRGKRYKEPVFVESDILQDSEFCKDLEKISTETGKSTVELSREASDYIKELVPRSTPLGLDLLIRLSRFVYTRGYDPVIDCDPEQVERLRALSEEHPVVLLCNHRSQVDSFSIYSALYDNDLPHPHTFGGINMKMPIIGNIMRASGMVFIRRAFSDNPVYKSVLQRYIDYLVSRRFPLLWSIEGGRSRTGKLIQPRYGLLGWLLGAAERYDKASPLYIVPLSIVFEQVADIDAYTHEQLGGVKKPENLSWFYNYLKSFKTPLGKIHIRFGDPVHAHVDAEQARDKLAVEKLAFETCVALDASTPVTKASLICMALLAATPQALTRMELRDEVARLLDYLRGQQRPATFPDTMTAEELLHAGLPALLDSGVLQCFEAGIEAVYRVADERALDAAYYRNNAIHFFFTGAIADLALSALYLDGCNAEPLQQLEQEALNLRKILQWEFFFPAKEEFLAELYRDLDYRHPGWRELLSQGKPGLRTLFTELTPVLGHGALEPYMEAYRIVAEQLLEWDGAREFDQKAFVQACLNTGKQLQMQRQVVSGESVAKAMFDNGIRVARARGLLNHGHNPIAIEAQRQTYAAEMRAMNRRVRALRSLASARRSGILS